MRKTVRQEAILAQVVRDGRVVVEELAARLGVSGMTVRRDLAELADAGKLNRVHGGALASRSGVVGFSFRERANAMAAEKHAIAQRVARMIQPGSSVSLDTGTTTLEVAKALAPRDGKVRRLARLLKGCKISEGVKKQRGRGHLP